MTKRLPGYAVDDESLRLGEKSAPDFGPLFIVPPSVPVDTSIEAAAKIAPHAARDRARILAHLKSLGAFGATCREISVALGLNENCTRPRLWELEGNAPAGRPKLPRLIGKSKARRAGMRAYCCVQFLQS